MSGPPAPAGSGGPAGSGRAPGLAERLAVGFTRVLRGCGVAVPADAASGYLEALAAVGLAEPAGVYWAGRATLVRRPEDVESYDRCFAAFFSASPPAPAPSTATAGATVLQIPVAAEAPGEAQDEQAEAGSAGALARYSAVEVLRDKDFASCDPSELAELERLVDTLRPLGGTRPSRRSRPAGGRGRRPDLRRTARLALRHGGEPIRRAWLDPAEAPRRLVLLCDVSGSMATYARPLLRFAHAAVVARRKVDAFTIGTRLTRVTRELAGHDADTALAAAARAVADWSGGTRLGEALAQFNDRWGVPGLARGAVVVILSDGWDRGPAEQLAAEMARLGRVAHLVVWVNPLKASPGYEPLARGMAAALPFVDRFLPGHSLAALEQLAEVVASATSLRRGPDRLRQLEKRPSWS